jgi:hypothetical protein
VRLPDWALVEEQWPVPVAGAVLFDIGIRLRGAVVDVAGRGEGVVADSGRVVGESFAAVESVVTGRVVHARDFAVDEGSGPRHAGVELVLSVDDRLMHAQIGGQAGEVEVGSLLSVRGQLCVIGDYEWDAFDLVDTRGSWSVVELRRLLHGDYLVGLLPW